MIDPDDVYIFANGIRQHAIRWQGSESATLVLMLHGCGSNCWHWAPLASRLAEKFGDLVTIMALDHRGCGDSDKPRSGYSPKICAEDVLAVQDELKAGPVVLIGHSRGGWMSAYIACHWPDRVAGLVLVDPARMTFASIEAADEFYRRVEEGLGPFDSWEEALNNARARNPGAKWTPARDKGQRFGMCEEGGHIVGKMPRYVLEELRAVRLEGDDVGPYLSNIVAPTLLLVATTSNRGRQEEKLAYAAGINQAEIKRFHTTHYMHQDDPDSIANAIASFISTSELLAAR